MSSLFIVLDTMLRGIVIACIFFGGRYLIREARQGFPSLNDPSHSYAEAQVHAYNVVDEWNHYKGDSSISYFHKECASDYLNDNLARYQYFEVWLNEEDTECSCEYCE